MKKVQRKADGLVGVVIAEIWDDKKGDLLMVNFTTQHDSSGIQQSIEECSPDDVEEVL